MSRSPPHRQTRGLLALLLLVIALLPGCRPPTRQAPLPAGSTVLAFGDSITWGTGAEPGEDYPSRLAAGSGWRVVNAGIPGDTAELGRGRIAETLAVTRPALVLVELGGNDFLRRRPEAAVKDDLRQIVATIRQSGAQVVLIAIPRFSVVGVISGRLPDSPIYAELAGEEKLPVIEALLGRILADAELRADPIHPNALGYRKMAEDIASELGRLGLLARR